MWDIQEKEGQVVGLIPSPTNPGWSSLGVWMDGEAGAFDGEAGASV